MDQKWYEIKETGFRFVGGSKINPQYTDLKAGLRSLMRFKDQTPDLFTVDVELDRLSKSQTELLASNMLLRYEVTKGDYPEPVVALMWVVAWYAYHRLCGPEPAHVHLPAVRGRVPTAEFSCPFCGDMYYPQQEWTMDYALHQFGEWLRQHGKVKHHEERYTGRYHRRMDQEVRSKGYGIGLNLPVGPDKVLPEPQDPKAVRAASSIVPEPGD